MAHSLSIWLFKSSQFSSLICLSLLTCLLTNITSPFIWVLKFENRAMRFVILSALSVLTTLSLNIVFVVFLGKGIYGWVMAGSVSALISLGLFLGGSLSEIPKFSVSLKLCKELVVLGAPMIFSLVFIVILQHSNRYLLSELRGLHDVGLFTVGYNFGMILNLLVTAVCFAWPPYFMRFAEKPNEGAEKFSEIFTIYTISLGSVALGLFLFAKPVIRFMTTTEFYPAASVVGLIALSSFFYGAFHLFLPGVYFAKKVYLTLISQALSALFCVIAAFCLIPTWGIVGAAIALLIANVVLCAAQFCINVYGRLFQPAYDWKFLSLYCALLLSCLVLFEFWSLYPSIALYGVGLWRLTQGKVPLLARRQTA